MRAITLPSRAGLLRLVRRAMLEVILALAGLAICVCQLWNGEPNKALLGLAASAAGALIGMLLLHRSGALSLALRCPRLDEMGFQAGSPDAPWKVLSAADDALRTLAEEGRGYQDFFPEARRDLIAAAFRALESHRRFVRAGRALAMFGELLTEGERSPRKLLRDQAERADRELLALTQTLRELRARFVAATHAQHSVPDALPSLHALEARSEALTEANEAVQIRRRSIV
jgi:hypothetical protein